MTDTVFILPLPKRVYKRVYLYGFFALAFLVVSLKPFYAGDTAGMLAMWVGALVSCARMKPLFGNVHLRYDGKTLSVYSPPHGLVEVPADKIGSIRLRAGTGGMVFKFPEHFVIAYRDAERSVPVPTLELAQIEKLQAFFQTHFPEQWQDDAKLPGFEKT